MSKKIIDKQRTLGALKKAFLKGELTTEELYNAFPYKDQIIERLNNTFPNGLPNGGLTPEVIDIIKSASMEVTNEIFRGVKLLTEEYQSYSPAFAKGEEEAQVLLEKWDNGSLTPTQWSEYIKGSPPSPDAIAWLIMKATDAGVLQKEQEIEEKSLAPGRRKGTEKRQEAAKNKRGTLHTAVFDYLKNNPKALVEGLDGLKKFFACSNFGYKQSTLNKYLEGEYNKYRAEIKKTPT